MTPLNVYLALGTLDPVSNAFTEISGAGGYARQSFALVPAGDGVLTGGDEAVATADVFFPVVTGSDWPGVTGYAVYDIATAGNLLFWWRTGAEAARVAKLGRQMRVEAGKIGLRPAQIETVLGGPLFSNVMLTVSVAGVSYGVGAGLVISGGTLVGQIISVPLIRGASYQWKLNGSNIPGAISNTYTTTSAGSHACAVTTAAVTVTTGGVVVKSSPYTGALGLMMGAY